MPIVFFSEKITDLFGGLIIMYYLCPIISKNLSDRKYYE